MKKQNIKKVTTASLFMGVVIASGLGLGISLSNSNTTTSNNLSNVLSNKATNNVSRAIDKVVRRQFNSGFVGDILTWGLGDAAGNNVVDTPAFDPTTGIFTMPNYVDSIETTSGHPIGADFYTSDASNTWMNNVKEIRFQNGSALARVGNEVFSYMAGLERVYFPQPANMRTPENKIVFHNGMHDRDSETAPNNSVPFANISNFSLSRWSYRQLPKPGKDVFREIVYPANMVYRTVDTAGKINPTAPTYDYLSTINTDGIFNNSIIANKSYAGDNNNNNSIIQPTSINTHYFNNVTVSMPNIPEVRAMLKIAISSISPTNNSPVYKWVSDNYNFYEVTGTPVADSTVINYVPATDNVMTEAQETTALATAQAGFRNLYAPNSSEWAIFNETMNGTVNQTNYLDNLNNDWNRISNLISGFTSVPQLGIIGDQYRNTGEAGSITKANSIFSVDNNANGSAKMLYTSNLIGNKGYLVNDITDADNPYYRSLKMQAVNDAPTSVWAEYEIQTALVNEKSDQIFDPLVYRSGTFNGIQTAIPQNYNYTTRHKLSGNEIFDGTTLSIPEYVTQIKSVENPLLDNEAIDTPDTTNYNYLWENTKKTAQYIKVNDFLVDTYSVSVNDDGQNQAIPATFKTVAPQLAILGDNAFSNFTQLKSLELPRTVTTIGKNLVSDSTSLTSVILPKSITALASGAFANSTSLQRFTMPYLGTGGVVSSADVVYTDMFKGLSPTITFIPHEDQAKFIEAEYGGMVSGSAGLTRYYKQTDLISTGINLDITNTDYLALEQAVKSQIEDPENTDLIAETQKLIDAFNTTYPSSDETPTTNVGRKKAWFSITGTVNPEVFSDDTVSNLTLSVTDGRIQFANGDLGTSLTDDSLLDFPLSSNSKLFSTIDVGTFKSYYGLPAGNLNLGDILNANSYAPILSDPGGDNAVGDAFGIIFAIVGGVAALILIIAIIFIVRRIVLSKRKALESSDSSESSNSNE